MSVGVELLGMTVLVGALYTGAAPAPAGGAFSHAFSVGTLGDSVGPKTKCRLYIYFWYYRFLVIGGGGRGVENFSRRFIL